MQPVKRSLAITALMVIVGMCAGSCTSPQLLRVHYQLPATSDSLEDIRVSLALKDMRRNKAFLSQSARETLSDFSGNFTLLVSPDDSSGTLLGAYNLTSAVKALFRQRLLHEGITVVDKKDGDAEMEIGLKECMLDLQGRNWVFSMSYQTNLLREGKLTASETITGRAERLKTIGGREAEKAISELVTDMVNKLEVAKLFRQAGF